MIVPVVEFNVKSVLLVMFMLAAEVKVNTSWPEEFIITGPAQLTV